ncbi:MAG: ABC transporter ATP-binding protein, partial [Tissierellia bacterium]|nr:ABC transporter ATP-binding protein [Tissierellia bacterium]
MNNVIEVHNLNKKYDTFQLKNISFSIPEGCIVGFVGLNGQGKTTTIKTLLGLSKKDSGKVKIFGKDFDSNEKEIKSDLAVVFDDGYLYDSLKMKEMKNIVAGAYPSWDEKEYKNYIKKFSLDENQKIATLSKGMKMKFALALALSHHAKFIIMDEPTSGLDPLIRKELSKILSDYMNKDGLGVFYSTHITSDLDTFADIIIMINQGEIVFVEDKDTLLDRHRIVKGDKNELNKEIESLFVKLEQNNYGFTGITNAYEELKCIKPDFVFEKATVEDIMLSY